MTILYSDTCADYVSVVASVPNTNLHFLHPVIIDTLVTNDNACFFLSCQEKLKKDQMLLKGAIDDFENLTDFLMDFEEDE